MFPLEQMNQGDDPSKPNLGLSQLQMDGLGGGLDFDGPNNSVMGGARNNG